MYKKYGYLYSGYLKISTTRWIKYWFVSAVNSKLSESFIP